MVWEAWIDVFQESMQELYAIIMYAFKRCLVDTQLQYM